MTVEIEAAGALLASFASILLVTCCLQNIMAWSRAKGFGTLPAGLLLGAASIAQMINPIEPFDGFIFDLRNIPLALAGAFTGWRAALLAATMAAMTRWGIGGTGMMPGIVAIYWAAGAGCFWQWLATKRSNRSIIAKLSLGALTATTLWVGILVPQPVQIWFFLNAAPVLFVIYITIVPALAWIAEKGFFLTSAAQQNIKSVFRHHGIELLALPSFVHQIRLDDMLNANAPVKAVLSLKIDDLQQLKSRDAKTSPEAILDAVVLKLAKGLPDIRFFGTLEHDTLLLPITQDQLTQLDVIKDKIRESLCGAPLILPRQYRHWISFSLSIFHAETFDRYEEIAPNITPFRKPADAQAQRILNIRAAPGKQLPQSSRFKGSENHDMLFLKAKYLMKTGT